MELVAVCGGVVARSSLLDGGEEGKEDSLFSTQTIVESEKAKDKEKDRVLQMMDGEVRTCGIERSGGLSCSSDEVRAACWS